MYLIKMLKPPQISGDALKAEIERLYQTDTWAALALAQKHNIKCVMYEEKSDLSS